MDFFNKMKSNANNNVEYNMSVTENGAIGFKTTGANLLDINFAVASLRSATHSNICDRFFKAYAEDPKYAVLWLFYVRDIREGLGERRLFNILFPTFLERIERDYPIGTIEKLINLVSEYGRFDDLYSIVELAPQYDPLVAKLFKEQLEKDIANMNAGKSVSLLAKWLKSEQASSKKSKKLASWTMKMLDMKPSEYRKTISSLRKYIDIVEVKMSNKDWSLIDYEKVPSRASLLYKNAFKKNDGERYEEFISKVNSGEKKINAATLYPHDIVHQYTSTSGWRYDVKSFDPSIEALWKNLPNTVNEDSRTLVVADGSGSMTMNIGNSNVTALEVANALAIYFAERAQGPYANKYITFSSRPQFVDFTNCSSLRDKIKVALQHSEVSNTNIEKVFDLILDTAIKNKCSQDEIPNNILILSDMEFDSATYGRTNKSLFQNIAEKYENAGYKLPRLVFWNLNSRTGTIPVTQNDLGVALISGFSVNLVKMVLDGETDPYKCLLKVLDSKRYNPIKSILQK